MSALSEVISKFFAERVFGHMSSTIAGAISAVAVALGTYMQTIQLPSPWNYVGYGLAFVLLAIGAAYKKPQAVP